MTKKEDNQHDFARQRQSDDAAATTSQAPTASAMQGNVKRRIVRKNRKAVKFADPLSEARVYDRALSPKAEEANKLANNRNRVVTSLNELEPPYTLVARLDIAAKKLEARPVAKSATPDDTLTLMKTSKSLKSVKSSVPKSPAKKD